MVTLVSKVLQKIIIMISCQVAYKDMITNVFRSVVIAMYSYGIARYVQMMNCIKGLLILFLLLLFLCHIKILMQIE